MANESRYSVFYNAYNLNTLDSTGNSSNNLTDSDMLNSGLSYDPEVFQFIVQGVGVFIISCLGIIGNILSIIVLSHRKMRSSISFLLIGLALCDLIILFNSILVLGLPTILQYRRSGTNASAETFLRFGHLVPIVIGVAATAVTGSVFFTVAVTMERYLFVCRPFLARRICTWQRAIQFSVGIIGAAALMNLPRWWEYTCVTVYESDDNTTVIGCRPVPTDMKTNHLYDLLYFNLLYLIVQVISPLVCLVFVNTLIYLKIKAANANRKNLSTSQSKENSLAYMLLIVVAVFVICNILPLFIVISKLVIRTMGSWGPEIETVGLFLVIFNSSVNFAIYCLYGEKFRRVLLEIMCPASCRPNMGRQSRMESNSSHCSQISQITSMKQKHHNASVRTVCEQV